MRQKATLKDIQIKNSQLYVNYSKLSGSIIKSERNHERIERVIQNAMRIQSKKHRSLKRSYEQKESSIMQRRALAELELAKSKLANCIIE